MTTIAAPQAMLGRILYLLKEGAKETNVGLSDATAGLLAQGMFKVMLDNGVQITWVMAPLDAAQKCSRKAEIARYWHEKTGAEGWLLLMEVWNSQAREYLSMSAYGEVGQ